MSAFWVKMIAIVAMLLDHTAKIIGQNGFLTLFCGSAEEATMEMMRFSSNILDVMETVGRIAFPLFAYQIAVGAEKTRSMPRYLGRLFLFALISEPLYYMAFSRRELSVRDFWDSLCALNFTNVFFTLFLGALAIYAYQFLQKRFPKRAWIPSLPVFLLILFVSGYVDCDYGMAGVLLIVCLYLAKTKKSKMLVIVLWSLWLYLLDQAFNGHGFVWNQVSGLHVGYALGAAAACVPVLLYNGQRGKSWKWFFYIFYPAHLAVLLLIRFLVLSGV